MVDLFGGAMTTSIPSAWRDVSQVRQVPDNQEVYQDCAEDSGAIMVIEILERQTDVSDDEACSFFLKDLADANGVSMEGQHYSNGGSAVVINLLGDEARKMELFPTFSLAATTTTTTTTSSSSSSSLKACIAKGYQKVAQGKQGTSTEKGARWIDVEMCILRLENVNTDLLISASVPRKLEIMARGEEKEDEYSAVFKDALRDFNILDWGLFA